MSVFSRKSLLWRIHLPVHLPQRLRSGLGTEGKILLVKIVFVLTTIWAMVGTDNAARAAAAKHHPKSSLAKSSATAKTVGKAKAPGTKTAKANHSSSRRSARTAKLKMAFVASTELRPMAQQLAATLRYKLRHMQGSLPTPAITRGRRPLPHIWP